MLCIHKYPIAGTGSSIGRRLVLLQCDGKNKGKLTDNILEVLKKYCNDQNIDFHEKYTKFYGKGENSWLSSVIDKKKITFRDACEYLCRPEIYDDYKALCAFVHGQDVYSKLMPFTFYSSII